ncbi:hypothetical protein A3762_15685 [Oleiphilus sp. HI0125]|uniref:energy transducer TonB family protein n=1 Tax=Oleiphilus sp. HI0125 TaxID=1822266 RepID=UPI0007C380AF|nr:energy transducer TonB [Oleiphilus sp. HI0125]KZZ60204.1 hypothetical protein A3762_15685 [Oleiphilus sp. HI0125]
MSINYKQQTVLPRLTLLSTVLHGLLLLFYYSLPKDQVESSSSSQTINVALSRVQPRVTEVVEDVLPPEEPTIPEPETAKEEDLIDHHIHEYKRGDEFSSNNQDVTKEAQLDFGAKQEIVKKKQSSKETIGEREALSTINKEARVDLAGNKTKQEDDSSGVSDNIGSGEELDTNDSSGEAEIGAESDIAFIPPEELKIPPEFLGNLGNMELLEENDLGNAYVEDPFSEQESKEFKVVNRYLKRFTEQVYEYWVNPYQGAKLFKGVIKLELDTSGYIVNAFIFKSSGHRLLDISALDAIRAVPRYEVPDNPVITERYYTNLSFYYSSIEEKTELMPFEVAEQN